MDDWTYFSTDFQPWGRDARECRWHTCEIAIWQWESTKLLGPVTHRAVDTAALRLVVLARQDTPRGDRSRFLPLPLPPVFNRWPPSEQNRRLVLHLWGKYQRWLFSVKISVSKWPPLACLLFTFDLDFLKDCSFSEWFFLNQLFHVVGRDPDVGHLSLLSLYCGFYEIHRFEMFQEKILCFYLKFLDLIENGLEFWISVEKMWFWLNDKEIKDSEKPPVENHWF